MPKAGISMLDGVGWGSVPVVMVGSCKGASLVSSLCQFLTQ
jgi:hypothetical protein